MKVFECSVKTMLESEHFGLCEFDDIPGCRYFQNDPDAKLGELCRCYPDDCVYKILEDFGGYLVIINEQHSLLPTQEMLLKDKPVFLIKIPASGVVLEDQFYLAKTLVGILDRYPLTTLVFASSIPFLLREVMIEVMLPDSANYTRIRIFHNDRREKKELPDGKIIYTIPAEGWKLV